MRLIILITAVMVSCLVFLGALAAAPPATAAAPMSQQTSMLLESRVVTYRGITVTWSMNDLSDATFTESPGLPDTVGNTNDITIGQAAISAYAQTKFRATMLSQGGIAIASVNGCTFSPDQWGRANFNGVCNAHDICYGNQQRISRLACDLRFLTGLRAVCTSSYPRTNQVVRRNACYGVAAGYYNAVRKFGYFNYKGNGERA